MLVNIETITKLTGSASRTIKSRCEHLTQHTQEGGGRSIFFESKEALPLMYGRNELNEGKKTLEEERTRLASAQADKTELEVEVIKGNLIPADAVEAVVNRMISSFRAKMMSLPTKAAPVVSVQADTAEIEDILKEYVYEALEELSQYESEQYSAQDDQQVGKTGSTTTKMDSKSVGRPKKKTKQGSKRRTRTVEH